MPNRVSPPRRALACAAGLAIVSTALYAVVGCASKNAANPANQTAIQNYVQGVKAYQRGETDNAVANLQEAVAKQGDLIMARSMLGDIYRARSDYEAAREQYQTLTRLDPYDYFHHYRLGLSFQFLTLLNEAATSYARAIVLKPTDAQSNMALGTVYLDLGRPAEAVPYAIRAAELDPKSASVQIALGVVLDANSRYPEAERAYRKALDIDSSQRVIQLYLAENLMRQRKFGESRSVLSELIKVEDTTLHRERLGDAFMGDKDFAGAIYQYQTALKLDPEYYRALNKIATANIADYEKGLTLDDAKRKAALDAWQQSLAIKREQPAIVMQVQKYSKAPMFQP